ncbi:hypothetical protein D9613_012617 [Agrocybe pediades]|uniref:Uncharacterized protein n=1 Tax=Agrocybe pediades TaxID=84607 RepID=A0A8H4VTH7_9AGAR|nr:hypothetical protein D9613_012617 [Agrocybe pediades]
MLANLQYCRGAANTRILLKSSTCPPIQFLPGLATHPRRSVLAASMNEGSIKTTLPILSMLPLTASASKCTIYIHQHQLSIPRRIFARPQASIWQLAQWQRYSTLAYYRGRR